MRIIAGTRKGRAGSRRPKARRRGPTGDRVREAAFNLIGPVEEARVLDLYAGSGAMGLEALSRGAARCVFVESDRGACRVIQSNLEKLRLDRRCRPLPRRARRAARGGVARASDTIWCSSTRPTAEYALPCK